MLDTGVWAVVEGPDGTGKTTMVQSVVADLTKRHPDLEIVASRHPGATALGKHIRSLIKTPHAFDDAASPDPIILDHLSEQLLMLVDHINFKALILEPLLKRGAIVVSDRCDLIGTLVYGRLCGLNIAQINSLIQLGLYPRADLMYILRCPEQVARDRIAARATKYDRFESLHGIYDKYETLLTESEGQSMLVNKIVPIDCITYIDTTKSLQESTRLISQDISKRAFAS